MQSLSERIANLPPAKRALLEIKLRQQTAALPQEMPIKRRVRREVAPLSFAQQRLWVLDQIEPGNSTYNMPLAVRLTGQFDLAAMEWALNEMIRRHESLRTTIVAIDEQPMQIIAESLNIKLELTDLRQVPETDRECASMRLIAAEAQQPFDLAHGPLLRARVLQTRDEEHILLFTVHHIISDGWSMGVLVRETATLYEAFINGQPSPLDDLPVQYADFAEWQREWLRGEVLERQLTYWREQLAGAPPVLELPTDYTRPNSQTFRGASHTIELTIELSTALRALSKTENATLFMPLLATFLVLLQRYTGQDDIVVGTPIAGRNRPAVEGLIGFFINSLALRVDLSGEPAFREVLRRVRAVTLEAYTHQDVPFEKILEELNPERSLNRTPLFQVFFNMGNLPFERIELPGLTGESLYAPDYGSKFDLTLYLNDQSENIALSLVYNRDLFKEARMTEMLDQFSYLLTQIVAQPDQPISRLSLVTPAARKVLSSPYDVLDDTWQGAVHTLFSEQAQRVPHHLAVTDEQNAWTYEELEKRSNQLAHHLRASGIQAGDRVAIYAHRSASLVWAILGTMKAGAAFMILDPGYPEARLIEYLRMAQPRGWLRVAAAGAPPDELEQFVETLSCCCRITLPPRTNAEQQDFLSEYPLTAPGVSVGPDDVAYVAFTSGTTGKPNGVLGRHGPLTHFLPWLEKTFTLDETDRFSMLSGLAHDPLHRDIFTPLMLGGRVCIPDPEKIGMTGWLPRWLEQEQITVANLTPAMGRLLVESAAGETVADLSPVRYLFFVGEILTQRNLSALRKLFRRTTFVNLYGATETQRAISYHVVPDREETDGAQVKEEIPLGRGIDDVQLLILNASGQLAGIGEIGEIYFRSPQLAKGYLDNELLTRERFILNPFTKASGDRLYRTGDLGRYLPDGTVESLGRADKQVQIRGFRVEPGEIENVLARHPAVRESVVIAQDVEPGEKRLVAYVVAGQNAPPSISDLRQFVRSHLPDYMAPSAFVFIDSIPLTANGKINRQALPAPDPTAQGAAAETEAGPRTVTEKLLSVIWANVLNVESIDVEANFFEVGGHSLMATQVIARVCHAFNIQITLRSLFEAPTVRALAAVIEAAMLNERGLALPPVVPLPRAQYSPVSYAQQRLWLLDRLEPGNVAYNLPGAVRMTGELDVAALERTISEIIRRHEVLRTTFTSVDGEPVQVIGEPTPVALRVIDLQDLLEDERETEAHRLAAEEALRPFDLSRGPLLRTTLLTLSAQEHVVLLTMHHIVSDGWSMGVLIREVALLYEAYARGAESPLAELPVQYADFAGWQRGWLQGEVLERQLSYWRSQLKGAPAVLELPIDRPRPPVQTFRGALEWFSLSTELTQKLNRLSREQAVTPFMTLLAAFQTLLHRYSLQEDIVVSTGIANRANAALESLIGFFVNTLVLRSDLSGSPTFRELLKRVREVTLEAYAHQDLPFEVLVEALQPERDPSYSPLFQVMFVLQNAPQEELELPSLRLSPFIAERTTAKFDLTLFMIEDEERFTGYFEYNLDLFDTETIVQMTHHFQNLLEGIVEDADRQLKDILLTREEESELVGAFNDDL
jgi:amino acid adenylation domain-containing protein